MGSTPQDQNISQPGPMDLAKGMLGMGGPQDAKSIRNTSIAQMVMASVSVLLGSLMVTGVIGFGFWIFTPVILGGITLAGAGFALLKGLHGLYKWRQKLGEEKQQQEASRLEKQQQQEAQERQRIQEEQRQAELRNNVLEKGVLPRFVIAWNCRDGIGRLLAEEFKLDVVYYEDGSLKEAAIINAPKEIVARIDAAFNGMTDEQVKEQMKDPDSKLCKRLKGIIQSNNDTTALNNQETQQSQSKPAPKPKGAAKPKT